MRFKKKIYCFSLLSFWTLFGLAFFCVLASFTFAQDNRQLVLEKPPTSDKRIALVIGNGAYTKAKTLPNPANDAIDMAAALKTLGFEVISGTDQNKRQMETLIREFGSKLANGGVGLFYYAGHGIQVNGYNYLVPVSGPSAFYQASITAALSSKFRPTLSEGKPIAVIREYSYSFDDGSRTPCGDRPLRIFGIHG